MSSCPTQRSWYESRVWGPDPTPGSGALISHQGLGPEQRDESLLPMPRVMV